MSDRPVFVGRLMTSPARTVSRDATLADAATKLHRHGLGSAVVVDQDTRLAGIITDTDLVRAAAENADPATVTVDRYLTTDVVTTAADESAIDAAARMRRAGVNHLPVVDDSDGVVGMLTSTDLSAYVARDGVPEPASRENDEEAEETDADASDDPEAEADTASETDTESPDDSDATAGTNAADGA